MHKPRRFHLERTEDVSGTSGTGVVAQGCEFINGLVCMTWIAQCFPSMVMFTSIKALEEVHGHEGRTKVVWDD